MCWDYKWGGHRALSSPLPGGPGVLCLWGDGFGAPDKVCGVFSETLWEMVGEELCSHSNMDVVKNLSLCGTDGGTPEEHLGQCVGNAGVCSIYLN